MRLRPVPTRSRQTGVSAGGVDGRGTRDSDKPVRLAPDGGFEVPKWTRVSTTAGLPGAGAVRGVFGAP